MTLFSYWMREIIPQFFTSLCVLSAIIVLSQLIRLTEVIATFGISLENVMMPFLFILVPFLTFTIPLAYMFAVLLSFSRMSADGEFTGMLAAGYSLRRAAVPVMLLASILCAITMASAHYAEPWGNRERKAFYKRKAETQLDNMIRYNMKAGVFLDNFIGYVIYAEEISEDRSRLSNVLLAPGPSIKNQDFTLIAPRASITGTVEDGDLEMAFRDGAVYTHRPELDEFEVLKFDEIKLDMLSIFHEQIFGVSYGLDYRALNPGQLIEFIEKSGKQKVRSKAKRKHHLRAHYLYHQRFGMPFSIVFFAMFAMVLGIQDERRGKSYGYLGTIFAIIMSYVLVMSFKYWAEKGQLAAPLAVWIPNVILFVFGLFLVYQRNRLPPSESTLDRRYLPLIGGLFKRS